MKKMKSFLMLLAIAGASFNDTFYVYMIGTGTAKGDIMYIDMKRNSSSTAKAKARNAEMTNASSNFGTKSIRTPFAGAVKALPRR